MRKIIVIERHVFDAEKLSLWELSCNMFYFFNNKIIETVKSKLGYKLQVKKQKGKYILDAEHVNYSFGGLHKVFLDAFKNAGIRERAVSDVLILGFGAGSVASILRADYRMDCFITGIEVDEKVIELAKKYFEIESFNKLRIVQQDARDFIQHDRQCYDLVIVDLYEDFRVPEFAESRDFLVQVKRLMHKGGLMFFNKMIYNIESEVSAAKLKANLIDTFAVVKEYRMKFAVSNTMFVCEKR